MEKEVKRFRVIADYNKQSDNEISLKVGDFVEVLLRGQNIWYGRINETKGFFPRNVVQSQSDLDNNTEELSRSVESSAKDLIENTSNEKKCFDSIAETDTLPDNHKTRVHGIGRPPSYIFLKNTILEKGVEYWGSSSSEDELEETMYKQNLKQIPQKEPDLVDKSAGDKPDWMKALNNKQKNNTAPAVLKETTEAVPIKVPSWMEEIRKRKISRGNGLAEEEVITDVVKTVHVACVKQTSNEVVSSIGKNSETTLLTNKEDKTETGFTKITKTQDTLRQRFVSETEKNPPIVEIKTHESQVIKSKSETNIIQNSIKDTTNNKTNNDTKTEKTKPTESKPTKSDITLELPKAVPASNTNETRTIKNASLRLETSNEQVASKQTAVTSAALSDAITITKKTGVTENATTLVETAKLVETNEQVKNRSQKFENAQEMHKTQKSSSSSATQTTITINKVNTTVKTPLENSSVSENVIKKTDSNSVNTLNLKKTEEPTHNQKVDAKVKLVLSKLDEFELQTREQTLNVKKELLNIQRQVDRHYEDIKNSVAQIKAQLCEISQL